MNSIDKKLDNPRYKESKKFKKGGFFSTGKTANFVPGRKKKGGTIIGTYKSKKEVEFFDDD